MIPEEKIREQLRFTLERTDFDIGKKYQGKVRDNHILNGRRIIIVTDRISAFDRVLCTIPFKGQVLNQMAAFWFNETRDIVNNHMISVPDPNVMVVRECKPLPVEMVVRGYITGVTTTSAWYNYERGVRDFCGNILPEGLRKNQKFERPIITPSTKAEKGGHDVSLAPAEIVEKGMVSKELMDELIEVSFRLYDRGVSMCRKQGIILVDTKYEFGLINNELTLMDEIHTPDSSRFWFTDTYDELFEEGEEQKKIDKEYVREWLAAKGFIGEGEIPEIPDEIKAEAARRYIQAFELITGEEFGAGVGEVKERIRDSLERGGFLSAT